jgi:hypothetical protein
MDFSKIPAQRTPVPSFLYTAEQSLSVVDEGSIEKLA